MRTHPRAIKFIAHALFNYAFVTENILLHNDVDFFII